MHRDYNDVFAAVWSYSGSVIILPHSCYDVLTYIQKKAIVFRAIFHCNAAIAAISSLNWIFENKEEKYLKVCECIYRDCVQLRTCRYDRN